MNFCNKKLFAASAAYILGMKPEVKIKGTSDIINSYKLVLEDSKNLYTALNEGTNLQAVEECIAAKRKSAHSFYNSTGIVWPF